MLRLATTLTVIALCSTPGFAEVRFGKNVRIGGHDVSGQTFDKNNRGKFIIYDKQPKNAGCKIRKNKDGSRTKVCHLKRKKSKNDR